MPGETGSKGGGSLPGKGRQTPDPISAQVVLSAPGRHRASAVMRHFAENGFDVGPMVGTSFAISGSAELFSSFFGLPRGAKPEDIFRPEALPTLVPPASLRDDVESILFTPPPDFGPTSF